MFQEAEHRMFIGPQHYNQEYLQSNITHLKEIHDWLANTAVPYVHDVKLILNQLRNLVWEIELCIVTLVSIGASTVSIARSTKDVVQGMYHQACRFLQRLATPVAADQTPAPAQEQVHHPNPWTPVHGQQQHHHANPSFPALAQEQGPHPNPWVPVHDQQQRYDTNPSFPIPAQSQSHYNNTSIPVPDQQQPYYTTPASLRHSLMEPTPRVPYQQ